MLTWVAHRSYNPLQETESTQLLVELLSSNDFDRYVERYSISLTYAFICGFRVKSGDDPSIAEIHRVQDNLCPRRRLRQMDFE